MFRRHLLFLLFFLFTTIIGNGTCLAIGGPSEQGKQNNILKVISTKKNNGLSSKIFYFHQQEDCNKGLQQQQQQNNNNILFKKEKKILQYYNTKLKSCLVSVFLPMGYPKSTPDGYLRYACWSWVQDLSTQLRGVLATQRILEGVGVGRQGATSLSALLNFLIRDGCGMAANLLFTAMASSSFRIDAKRWRIFADTMIDIGITLEVAATIVPKALFLPMICKYVYRLDVFFFPPQYIYLDSFSFS